MSHYLWGWGWWGECFFGQNVKLITETSNLEFLFWIKGTECFFSTLEHSKTSRTVHLSAFTTLQIWRIVTEKTTSSLAIFSLLLCFSILSGCHFPRTKYTHAPLPFPHYLSIHYKVTAIDTENILKVDIYFFNVKC